MEMEEKAVTIERSRVVSFVLLGHDTTEVLTALQGIEIGDAETLYCTPYLLNYGNPIKFKTVTIFPTLAIPILLEVSKVSIHNRIQAHRRSIL
jgi:hypothetical protein